MEHQLQNSPRVQVAGSQSMANPVIFSSTAEMGQEMHIFVGILLHTATGSNAIFQTWEPPPPQVIGHFFLYYFFFI